MAEENVAVLIDFENINNQNHMRALLDELSGIGRLSIKRAFGDWNKADTDGQQQLQTLGIELIHHSQTTSGKNASDIRLTIDAIELLHTSAVPIDTFVIASGDSDFFPLITILRSYGKSVIVAGRKDSTTEMLVSSCDRFIDLSELATTTDRSELSNPEDTLKSANGYPPSFTSESTSRRLSGSNATTSTSRRSTNVTTRHSTIGLETRRLVVRAIRSAQDNEGQVKGAKLHETIRRIDASFDFRQYGFDSLSDFLDGVPEVKVERSNGPRDITVRIAPNM